MKERITGSVKTHLLGGAFYLVLSIGICLIPFALAQRTTWRAPANIITVTKLNACDSGTAALPMPEFPAGFPLWDQYDNPATQPPINIGSQDFEPAVDTLDDQAADDFVLATPPPGISILITGVCVMGEYSEGGGPAAWFNVYFYSNGAGNLPATLIGAYLNLPYTGTPPDFTINLPHPVPFGPRTLWVSVQARQDFNTSGQWFWHNRTVQSNAAAAWQNPGNGYGTGCITWNPKNSAWPIKCGPIRFSRSSASRKVIRPVQHQRLQPQLQLHPV